VVLTPLCASSQEDEAVTVLVNDACLLDTEGLVHPVSQAPRGQSTGLTRSSCLPPGGRWHLEDVYPQELMPGVETTATELPLRAFRPWSDGLEIEDQVLSDQLVEDLEPLEDLWRQHLGEVLSEPPSEELLPGLPLPKWVRSRLEDRRPRRPAGWMVLLDNEYVGRSGETTLGTLRVDAELCQVVSVKGEWLLEDCTLPKEGTAEAELALFPMTGGDADVAFGLHPDRPAGNRAGAGGSPLLQVTGIPATMTRGERRRPLERLRTHGETAVAEGFPLGKLLLLIGSLLGGGLLAHRGWSQLRARRTPELLTDEEPPELLPITDGPPELSETREADAAALAPVATPLDESARVPVGATLVEPELETDEVEPPPGDDLLLPEPEPEAPTGPLTPPEPPPVYEPVLGGRPLALPRAGQEWLAGSDWSRAVRTACRHSAGVGQVDLLPEGRGFQIVWRLGVIGSWQEAAAVVYAHRAAEDLAGVPGAAEEHESLMERLVAFELTCWRALDLDRAIAEAPRAMEELPLAAIRDAWQTLLSPIAVLHDEQEWEGYLRPYVPWPSLAERSVPLHVLREGLDELLAILSGSPGVEGPLVEVGELMEDLKGGKWRHPGRLGRRMVLVNPRPGDRRWPRLLPTQWRPFHLDWRDAFCWETT